MMTQTNALRPLLTLASFNLLPKESEKRKPDLKLVVNDSFSKLSVLNARQLALWIEKEFLRRTCDCTLSKATSVQLDFVPEDKDLETACSIIVGRGYRAEAHRHEPIYPNEELLVTVWVERRAHQA